MKHISLELEKLEQRIAPGSCGCGGSSASGSKESSASGSKESSASGSKESEHCNNGWGNGEDCAPGNSLEHQPKFEDPNTGPSPANSPAAADGDR